MLRTTVIIKVGSDALWGNLARGVLHHRQGLRKKNHETIIIFSLKCSS